MKDKKSLLKSGLVLSLMTFVSRIMGLLRERVKAGYLGTSGYADAFGIAFMIPNLLRRLFAENSISVAFVPTFKGYLEEHIFEKDKTQEFISATLTLVSFLTAIITVLGIALAYFIVPVFYPKSADSALLSETVLLTRIMFPYLFVISTAAFFQGILNGCKIFAPSGFTPVIFNGVVIAVTVFLTPQLPNPNNLPFEAQAARAMSFAVLTGGCFQAIFQWPFVYSTGWKTTLTGLKKAFTNPGTKKVVSLIVPTIVGMAAYQLNDLISTALAGRKAGTGTVSSLQYSLRLQELILGIFAVSIGTVILPDLAGLAKKKLWTEFNNMLGKAVRIIAIITIPVTFFSLIFGNELISLLYKTRNFTDDSVRQTLEVFNFHIIGLFFIALNRVVSPVFYAQGNTKLPTLAGIISFSINIMLVFILVSPMKGAGIALSLTVASFVNTVCLFAFMKKIDSMDWLGIAKDILIYSIRIVSFSVIASAPIYFARPFLLIKFSGFNRFIALGVPVLLGGAGFTLIGILLLFLFRDETLFDILLRIKRKRTA